MEYHEYQGKWKYRIGLEDSEVRNYNDADHYHTVANPAKDEKPGERWAEPPGYRPGRKTAGRRKKAKR